MALAGPVAAVGAATITPVTLSNYITPDCDSTQCPEAPASDTSTTTSQRADTGGRFDLGWALLGAVVCVLGLVAIAWARLRRR